MQSQPSGWPIVLTIAGSDSSGGAGIQADLKTFSALNTYGASVIAALTAQNTQGVQGVHVVPADFIEAQIASVFDDLDIRAVKIGMVGASPAIEAVHAGLSRYKKVPVVVDPVMVATSGDPLLDPGSEKTLCETLFPLADLITPNLQEAAHLLGKGMAGVEQEMRDQARELMKFGPKSVLVKGGHQIGTEAVDIYFDGQEFHRLSGPRIDTKNTHGTGCTLSSAIAAGLALGLDQMAALAQAKNYLSQALAQADNLKVGHGSGPVHHFAGRSG